MGPARGGKPPKHLGHYFVRQGARLGRLASQVLSRRFVRAVLAILAILLVTAAPLEAYVGPGAGFAVLSSFFAVFVAFIYAAIAMVTWPVRALVRLVRRRGAYREAKIRRAVIIGFDGMDPELASKYMEQGKLPHLARLGREGTFRRLATTLPPISPVAWSSFLTGVNPGKHNIYDFLAPERSTYLPYLSSAQVRGPARKVQIGKYAIPLGKPRIRMLRKARPFWHFLADSGIFCSILRVPITFPPEEFGGVLLSGMCVPDLQGSQGTFSFHTTCPAPAGGGPEGIIVSFERRGSQFHSYIPGPENPLLREPSQLRAPFIVRPHPERREAEIEIEHRQFTLREGEYSDWIELAFHAGLGTRIRGICRLYLKQVAPDLEVYATPVNIDPAKPALPVSHPLTYSVYLAKLLGPYATLGLAEDTWALDGGFIDHDAFLRQCYLIHDERERMFFDALEKTPRGLCACVFDITDRMQHMFWRLPGDERPPEGGPLSRPGGGPIEDLYRRMDDLVGRVLHRLGGDDLLLVISDHGFKAFERGVNLNTWLYREGYLALKDQAPSGRWLEGVDWQRTRAYAMGLNGIYVNQQGREKQGVVAAGAETESLKRELVRKLDGLVDPETGEVAVSTIRQSSEAFSGPYVENAPDLIVGYAEGYRASWDGVQGQVTQSVFEVNRKAWSGDHCIDPNLVPGVLFANRRIQAIDPSIVDLAPTILEQFGVRLPRYFDGRAWNVERAANGSRERDRSSLQPGILP